jgi:ribosomal protein S1
MQRCENFGLTITGITAKGLTGSLSGLPAFIPVSQIEKRVGGAWWTEEEMYREFLGRNLSVAILEVSRNSKKVVCSPSKARENDILRSLEVWYHV